MAILTNAGGPGILLTDWLPSFGLKLAELPASTQNKLKKILPPAANSHNPVDVLGDALADRYAGVFEILSQDKNIDAIIVALTPQRMTQIRETAEMIGKLKAKCDKTVVLCFMGELEIVKNYQTFADNHEPEFNYPLSAVKVLSRMYQYGLWQKEKLPAIVKVKTTKIKLPNKTGFITEDASQRILRQAKFPLYRAKFVRNIKEVAVAAKTIGYPVAVKVVSPQVVHKSDVGGVKIGIKNDIELEKAISEMNIEVRQKVKGVKISGYLVGEMVKGQEVIIGLKRDPQFGAVVMLGLGGIYTEIFKDVSFRIAPLSLVDAHKMISELKIYSLFKGSRGAKPLDEDALAKLLVKFADFALANPKIQEIDFNPVMVLPNGRGVKIVDVRIMM